MRTIKCYDCDEQFQGETQNEVLSQMLPHYLKFHKEVIQNASVEEKTEWMNQFKKDWEEAGG